MVHWRSLDVGGGGIAWEVAPTGFGGGSGLGVAPSGGWRWLLLAVGGGSFWHRLQLSEAVGGCSPCLHERRLTQVRLCLPQLWRPLDAIG